MKSTQYDYTNDDYSENIITYKATLTLVNLNVRRAYFHRNKIIDYSIQVPKQVYDVHDQQNWFYYLRIFFSLKSKNTEADINDA